MYLNGVEIEETFAEAFTMRGTRVTVTAVNERWARYAALAATGFATSVIGCGVEAGIEGPTASTPDGRFGLDCLFFAFSKEDMEKHLIKRIGQAIMTTPTSACFDGELPEFQGQGDTLNKVNIGGKLRFFGDSYQASKVIGNQRYWRIPVMDGEFLVQEEFTVAKAIGGGNFLILAESAEAALLAAEAAVEEMRTIRGVILPFPGGVVRSGSQVGSNYKFLSASTNTAYCPTIRGRLDSLLPDGVNAVLEIVIDGLTFEAVSRAMQVGINAATQVPGVQRITAGNYGGRLGKHHFHLQEILI
ncbi:formylmethanofuran--tetrahydromethanopterin N-formyltransferase [Desulfosporosinus sp. BICA1-9]|uniref:formylmethanofuran--tetrahydromethanopterin N-formyltransferase n=1 Tax=Desulfosporosinus sp. BICA1-9 TaxID=1531958 RepID=UPI00054B89B0|nr:formylmethanofuran--tetrahydromethanopterin N-formyltransferase [Desulfosporosinus sp. BICA1-9]KJS47817.1 MAG: formylmethanofuran--tetrahydromethanopterin formyltransferase [Peptococcaceae bacterium BRH_c23]KJS85890.1 MAG: formylmethanofuran--tetrahydromethanopterin formyltransferase [Desulfosporosinus sp. BICA1-9]KJS90132.1 MAG: formylmethanofuran--tetrahydromethanopterin formyltransferase [Desulfosporosinus sp. BICA1-9]HBW38088.1 formylmethanofuran--tetrahydromethanopterin N-formyltransfer